MNAEAIVYVVDDDEAVRKSLDRLIRSAGFAVQTFPSAREFLSCPPPPGPSCLILDLKMPEITGLELQEALIAAGRTIPIVFLTGFGRVGESVRAMKAGAVDFLEKPVKEKTLLESVRRAIDQDARHRKQAGELNAIRKRFARLTPRERDVFRLVITGMLNKQIAFQLAISEKTVKVHRARIMEKMEAPSLAALVRLAERLA